MSLALHRKATIKAFFIVIEGMTAQRIDPSDPISIAPYRDADAVPTMSLDQLVSVRWWFVKRPSDWTNWVAPL